MIEGAHQEAYEILVENRSILDALVEELLEKETLHKVEIEVIFKHVASRPKRPAWTGSSQRQPSRIPPVALKPRNNQNHGVEEKPKRKKKAAAKDE
jgi:cell division protease FtsH